MQNKSTTLKIGLFENTEKRNLFLGSLCEANIATLTSSEKNVPT